MNESSTDRTVTSTAAQDPSPALSAALSPTQASAQTSTQADRDEQLNAEFRPLSCRQCGTEVRVRKRSVQQTSVQWLCDATARCPYLARPNPGSAPVEGCPALSRTIQAAVQAGLIPSGPQ